MDWFFEHGFMGLLALFALVVVALWLVRAVFRGVKAAGGAFGDGWRKGGGD